MIWGHEGLVRVHHTRNKNFLPLVQLVERRIWDAKVTRSNRVWEICCGQWWSDRCLLSDYHKGSGRGKKGTYKGYYCDSSWELAYVIYNLDHNIKFERNEEFFPYEFNGEQHNYKPDFIENGIYVEIKGYFTEQVKAKEKAFPFPLKYLDTNGIKSYIDYVEKVYGKDYIRLYNKEWCDNW